VSHLPLERFLEAGGVAGGELVVLEAVRHRFAGDEHHAGVPSEQLVGAFTGQGDLDPVLGHPLRDHELPKRPHPLIRGLEPRHHRVEVLDEVFRRDQDLVVGAGDEPRVLALVEAGLVVVAGEDGESPELGGDAGDGGGVDAAGADESYRPRPRVDGSRDGRAEQRQQMVRHQVAFPS
jgi:hypothetical protein